MVKWYQSKSDNGNKLAFFNFLKSPKWSEEIEPLQYFFAWDWKFGEKTVQWYAKTACYTGPYLHTFIFYMLSVFHVKQHFVNYVEILHYMLLEMVQRKQLTLLKRPKMSYFVGLLLIKWKPIPLSVIKLLVPVVPIMKWVSV